MQVDQLDLLQQQMKRELQKQFEDEIHQIVTNRDQEVFELRKELEIVKNEMQRDEEKMQEVCEPHYCIFRGVGTGQTSQAMA